MGYINSIVHIQHEIKNILHSIRAWAQAYMNDIICEAKSLCDLLKKLCILFDIFLEYNICIKPTKSFLNYPDVGLIGQRVNSLGLITSKKKLRIINILTNPKTLGVLEYYLRHTSYLHNYIYFYI